MRNIASKNIDLELALQIQSTVLFVAKWGKENAHAAYSDRADRDPDHRRPHRAGDRDRQRQSRLKPQRGDADAEEPSVAVTGNVDGKRALSRPPAAWRRGAAPGSPVADP